MTPTKEYFEFANEIYDAYSESDLRKMFFSREADTAIFRKAARLARGDRLTGDHLEQVWLGFELLTNSPMLKQYKWHDLSRTQWQAGL